MDLAEVEKNLIEESVGRLQDFVRGLQSSHPDFFNQVVYDIWSASSFNLTDQHRFGVSLTDLVYRPAQFLPDGRLYEGTWNESSDQIEGLGVLVTSDGSILEGFFSGGHANGKARRITVADREEYVGDWKDDLRHGHGEVSTADGNRYSGSWERDCKHGSGIERWIDGATYNGAFFEGLKKGEGTF